MLLQRARTVYWKKWAAKHEYEELKEGVWLEPALALLRKKTKGDWTEKHRKVARKLLLEGGWVQQRLFDVGRMKVSVKLVTKKKVQKSIGSTIVQNGKRSERRSHKLLESGSKNEDFKERVEVAKMYRRESSE